MNNKGINNHIKDLFNVFAQDYNLLYPNWDEINNNIATGINNYIQTLNVKIANILDLGSGTGIGTLGLSALGYNVTSIDNSSEMLKCLSEKANSKNIAINIIKGDITQLDEIIQDKFDLILCRGNTITYIQEKDTKSVFSKIYNCLNPDGIFYLGLREWDNFLSSSGHVINHLSEIHFMDDILYDCYYEWEKNNGKMVHLDVIFSFYEDNNKRSIINKKKYGVEFFPHKINDLINKMREAYFRNVEITNILEEKMEGEEYTIIVGKK